MDVNELASHSCAIVIPHVQDSRACTSCYNRGVPIVGDEREVDLQASPIARRSEFAIALTECCFFLTAEGDSMDYKMGLYR
jgi:hypothetical protein